MNDDETMEMRDILLDGPFNEEEANFICEWAPEMGEDLDVLRMWINDYDMQPIPNNEVDDYLNDGYTVMLDCC